MKHLQINFILVGLSIDNFEILSVFPVLVFLRMKEIFKIRQKFVKKSLGRGDERKPCPMASVSGGHGLLSGIEVRRGEDARWIFLPADVSASKVLSLVTVQPGLRIYCADRVKT